MEMLEHRLVLSTVLVTSTKDSGEGSLRWAIENANGTSGTDAITFDASLADQPIVLGGEELRVTDDLTITGLGADDLTISGNNASRVFSIAAGVTVEISGVTIADGKAQHGAGIYNQGTLTVENCRVTNSPAPDPVRRDRRQARQRPELDQPGQQRPDCRSDLHHRRLRRLAGQREHRLVCRGQPTHA
jgi:hypothetical protein